MKKIIKSLLIAFLTLAGWSCLVFAGIIYGIKCFALMALVLMISSALGGLL